MNTSRLLSFNTGHISQRPHACLLSCNSFLLTQVEQGEPAKTSPTIIDVGDGDSEGE